MEEENLKGWSSGDVGARALLLLSGAPAIGNGLYCPPWGAALTPDRPPPSCQSVQLKGGPLCSSLYLSSFLWDSSSLLQSAVDSCCECRCHRMALAKQGKRVARNSVEVLLSGETAVGLAQARVMSGVLKSLPTFPCSGPSFNLSSLYKQSG